MALCSGATLLLGHSVLEHSDDYRRNNTRLLGKDLRIKAIFNFTIINPYGEESGGTCTDDRQRPP
jgi:hypothetical protein